MEPIVLVLMIGLLFVALITIVNAVRSLKQRGYLHKERIQAMEKGLPVDLDHLDNGRSPRRQSPAFYGTVWTAIGIGLIASGIAVDSPGYSSEMKQFIGFLQLWAYPAIALGLGLLLYALFTRKSRADRD